MTQLQIKTKGYLFFLSLVDFYFYSSLFCDGTSNYEGGGG